jgi:hypothetical protein
VQQKSIAAAAKISEPQPLSIIQPSKTRKMAKAGAAVKR